MSCDCANYIDCNDKPMESAVCDVNAHFEQEYHNEVRSDDIFEFYQKTNRRFYLGGEWNRTIDTNYIVTGCDVIFKHCGGTTSADPSSSHTEECSMETNVPYYVDRQRGIYVWKHTEEKLEASVVSHKTAKFRLKWGVEYFHKICIPDRVKTSGKEELIMVKDGVKIVIAGVSYEYNPYPVNEGTGGNWGLYGNVSNYGAAMETPNVACILLFPSPPKQATCLDPDCLYYGFYDYYAVDGGFTLNSLAEEDGGVDYFYPYWCRMMPLDPLWRSVADQRYEVSRSGNSINLAGTTPWSPPEPVTYPLPFGSFALDSKNNFIASCIHQFGEHAGNLGVVYNESSMGDLFDVLTKAKVPINTAQFTALYPVTPL